MSDGQAAGGWRELRRQVRVLQWGSALLAAGALCLLVVVLRRGAERPEILTIPLLRTQKVISEEMVLQAPEARHPVLIGRVNDTGGGEMTFYRAVSPVGAADEGAAPPALRLDAGGVRIFGRDGEIVASLRPGSAETGEGATLELGGGGEGRPRALLSSAGDGTVRLRLEGPGQRNIVTFRAGGTPPVSEILLEGGAKGNARIRLWVDETGHGRIVIVDDEGKQIWSAGD